MAIVAAIVIIIFLIMFISMFVLMAMTDFRMFLVFIGILVVSFFFALAIEWAGNYLF